MEGLERIDPWRLRVPRRDPMRVEPWIYADERIRVEEDSVRQLQDAAAVEGVWRVLATPDIHVGYGVPVGSVVATSGCVLPSAVGYDINCGMRLLATPLARREVDVERLARDLRREVPLGEGKANVRVSPGGLEAILDRGVAGLSEAAGADHAAWRERDPREEAADRECMEDGGSMAGDHRQVSPRGRERGAAQLATLGGGNHFIEFQEVEAVLDTAVAGRFGLAAGQLLVMMHTGSRGLGHQVGTDYMGLASGGARGADRRLGVLSLDCPEGRSYVGAMNAAANFAFANRQLLTVLVRAVLRRHLGRDLPVPLVYDVPHNMAKRERHEGREVWVHRKGATRAWPARLMAGTRFADCGQPVLIPGSMGTASYILVGTEASAESLHSVNHGAGRVMSRSQAAGGRHGRRRRRGAGEGRPAAISDEAFREAMRGVLLLAGDRAAVKEEAPQAYKDIDAVVHVVCEAGLARAVARLRPVAVLKG
ncbi:MAG: RtcB family protein [Planctomycetes bacterium]|nr:RtcB family protein [Planctomycetota bacterium]